MRKTGLDNVVFDKPTNKVIIEDSDFPIDVFPQTIQDIIIDLNKAQGLPVDFVSASMLFAVSTAIGNTHIAYLKKDIISSKITAALNISSVPILPVTVKPCQSSL